MMKAIWAGNTPYSKFLISVGIILLSAIFFSILSAVISTTIYGINIGELTALIADPSQPAALSVLKIIQTFSAFGAFVIPPFILAWLFSENPIAYLSLDRKSKKYSLLIVTVAMIASNPFINFLGELNAQMHLPGFLKGVETWMRDSEDKASELTKVFLDMRNPGDLLFNLFMIALLPALGEELVFRGIVQKLFFQWSKNVHVAVWISAVLFSAMHMQFYGFLPRLILGGMLGYMLAWSGSLWLPIMGHFINNAGAVLFTYLFQHGYTTVDPDKVGTANDFTSVGLSFLITFFLFFILYRRREVLRIDNSLRAL